MGQTYHELKEVNIDLTQAIAEHSADECVAYKTVAGEPIYMGYYFPKDYRKTTKYPAFVFVHGGGFASHKIFEEQSHWMGDFLGYLARYYANQGFVSISIDYRLASRDGQEKQFQIIDCYEDCCDAMDYILLHADEYGIDDNLIYLLGESAGGYLAGAMATFHYERRYAFRKIFLINAITDVLNTNWNKRVPRGSTHYALEKLNMQDRARFLSPLYQVDEQIGDVILIHGEQDSCVMLEDSENFYQRLRELSKKCELHIIKNTRHAFLLAEHTDNLKACKIGIEIINQAFLLGKDSESR